MQKEMREKQTVEQWWTLIKRAAAAWVDDYAPSMGAALSYYTIFSLAPLLLIVISVAGFFFGTEAVRGEIFGQLRGLMGDDAAKAIEALLSTVSKPSESMTAAVIGLAVLLIGATAVFGELQDATLGHRIIINPSARVKDVAPADIVNGCLQRVPVPGARPGWQAKTPAR